MACNDGRVSRVLVLGIGNLLWADEGFGIRCVDALNAAWSCPPEVTVLDGGTQGLYLLPHVQAVNRLLVFDAIDWGDAPGSLRTVIGTEVPRFMGAKKMSLHQTGFQEVLAAADLLDQAPAEIVLIGVQPERLDDFGGGLSDGVRAILPAALELGLDWLRRWGVSPQLRSGSAESLNAAALSIDAYEAGRPSAEIACRFGDARFLCEPVQI